MDMLAGHGPSQGGLAYSFGTEAAELIVIVSAPKAGTTPMIAISVNAGGSIRTVMQVTYPSIYIAQGEIASTVFRMVWRWLRSDAKLAPAQFDLLRSDVALAVNSFMKHLGLEQVVSFPEYLSVR